MSETFKTYWLIADAKVEKFASMKRQVLAGEIAVEISSEMQQQTHEERERRKQALALQDEEHHKVAAQREHDQSPIGQREAAKRTALNYPGGIVSSTGHPAFYELDQFAPDKTNRFK